MGSSWHTAGDGDIADHPVVEAAAVWTGPVVSKCLQQQAFIHIYHMLYKQWGPFLFHWATCEMNVHMAWKYWQIIKTESVRVCTGFIWFRIRPSGGRSWTLEWSFEFCERWEISWQAEQLLPFSRRTLQEVIFTNTAIIFLICPLLSARFASVNTSSSALCGTNFTLLTTWALIKYSIAYLSTVPVKYSKPVLLYNTEALQRC
jgi:hypothetical protein